MSFSHTMCGTCGKHDPLCRRCIQSEDGAPGPVCRCPDKRRLSKNPGGIPKRGWGKKK